MPIPKHFRSIFLFPIGLLLIPYFLASQLFAQEEDTSRAANSKVAEIIKTFEGRGVMADDSLPTAAEAAEKQFKMRSGLEMELVVAEPIVSQPLFLSWDSRGRMWVAQYRKYQYPAGLEVIRFDQHLRAVFDKVPDPPPKGTPGADVISVHEDTDGDGIYDSSKEVLTGLNIATSVQVGPNGIWVLNPPYLLFYPDANHDDVPDSDPEVHLTGFGLQDTHSVSNSLTWGPDGWLYAANGSTTTCDVSSAMTKGVRFDGQSIWRYHPTTKVFEVYAEGGGNTFSLEIDSKGHVFSGTNGGDTRGWYFPQGSYSEKNWGKHGPLTNPYAFGFFRPMKFEGDGRRFPQAFCIYEGGLFEDKYDGTIVAPNSMHNLIWNSQRSADGSTYRTVDVENLCESPDRWFRPVYSGIGPDGAIYIADWYDTRLSHVSPIDDWHKESGRVYRIKPSNSQPNYQDGDLHAASSQELIAKFSDPNKWIRQRAALELGWRNDKDVVEQLVEKVDSGSLESLWSLNLMGAMTSERAVRWLGNSDANVRRWVVRLLGDRHEGHSELANLARRETNVQVRSQLAATAKRVPSEFAIPMIEALLAHEEDFDDPHMPLMIWWALEKHANDWSQVSSLVSKEGTWKQRLFSDFVAERLMQRYASAATKSDLENCSQLLALAPNDNARMRLILGLNRAFQGRAIPELPESLSKILRESQAKLGDSGVVIGVRQGKTESVDEAIAILQNRSSDIQLQLELARLFGEVNQPKVVPILLALATGGLTSEPALQRVSIGSLAQYSDDSIATSLVGAFGGSISLEHSLRSTACRTLATRPTWAKVLLGELTSWRLKRDEVPVDVVQQLRSYQTAEIAADVDSVFGKAIEVASPQKLAELKRIKGIVSEKPGDVQAGKPIFVKRCGNCHQLFGEGAKVGPPLDGYERGKLDFWINAIIEPSLEIREGFQSYLVLTEDGRVMTGLIAAEDPKTITLRNVDNQLTVIDRDSIEELQAIKTSLMPEGLLAELTEAELKDLFAYLSYGAK